MEFQVIFQHVRKQHAWKNVYKWVTTPYLLLQGKQGIVGRNYRVYVPLLRRQQHRKRKNDGEAPGHKDSEKITQASGNVSMLRKMEGQI
jgi:hypothetical protein